MGKTSDKWEPSENQKAFLAAAQRLCYRKGYIREAANETGIDESAFRHWFRRGHKEEFAAWWRSEWEIWMSRRAPEWWARIEEVAGNDYDPGKAKPAPSSWVKMLLERFDKGYCPRLKTEVEHSGRIDGQGDGLSEQQMQALERLVSQGEPESEPESDE